MRRFAGRKVRDELGVEGFAVFNPAGRAGGYHREHAAVRYTIDQLGALLHYRKIGSEIGVEHLVESESAERGYQFAGNRGSHRHTEFLAESGSYGGSGLYHDVLIRVVQSFPDVLDIALLVQSADGAGKYALTAVDAR